MNRVQRRMEIREMKGRGPVALRNLGAVRWGDPLAQPVPHEMSRPTVIGKCATMETEHTGSHTAVRLRLDEPGASGATFEERPGGDRAGETPMEREYTVWQQRCCRGDRKKHRKRHQDG